MESIYSQHIFIFPFKILENKEEKNKRVEDLLVRKEEWEEYSPVEIDSLTLEKEKKNYTKNMLKYFTKYAKESLFKYGDERNNDYVMELHNTKYRDVDYKIDMSGKIYILKLKDIKVKFFDTSVGTLSFVLENNRYKEIEEVLNINTYGRKLFKAYEGEECPTITIGNNISEKISDAKINYENDREYLENKIINNFLLKKRIEPILDDRMYTVCQYLDEEKPNLEEKKSKISKYWYQYLFVDSSDFKTCQNDNMENELIEKSSYKRWGEFGTYFGVTRYSFMIWSQKNDFFAENIIFNQLKYIYFQMINILIAQKSSIVYLNEKINDLLEEKESEKSENEVYKEYLLYLSKLTFREITCQEQGIELYNLCREQMNIEILNDELNIKVQTLNDRAERENDRKENEFSKKVEKIGVWVAIFSVILGIFGVDSGYLNDFLKCILENLSGIFIGMVLIVSILLLIKHWKEIVKAFINLLRYKNDNRK